MTELEPGPPDPVGAVIRGYLQTHEIEFTEPQPGSFALALPGERKLSTPVRLDVGSHALAVHAFVCRRPDENHERVYRWLLQRNLKLYAVAFALDAHGGHLSRRPPAVVDRHR